MLAINQKELAVTVMLHKDHPVLFVTTSSDHNHIIRECLVFLGQHWLPGVSTWPDVPNRLAAAIVLCGDEELKNGQARCLHLLISYSTPVLIIDAGSRHSHSWAHLATRNNRVKYTAANDKAWHDACFHFLASLKQSLKVNDFSLLATSLTERQEKQAQLASA